MNLRGTYILFAALAVILGLFGLALWFGPDKDVSGYVLPSLHDAKKVATADDMVYLEIDRKRPVTEKLVFERDPETKTWKMTSPIETRVDSWAVDRLVGQIVGARRDDRAEVDNNKEKWGLETPAAVLRIKDKDGRQWEVSLGRESTGGDARALYVLSSDRKDEVLAVKRSDLDQAFKSVNELRARDLLAERGADLQYVKLKDGTNEVILEQTSGNNWRFQKPDLGKADYEGAGPSATEKGPTGVRGLLDAIAGLQVSYKSDQEHDFVADNAGDLVQYGLEPGAKDRLEIEVKRAAGAPTGADKSKTVTLTLLIGKKADEKGDKVYAKLANEKNVVRLEAKALEPIRSVLADPGKLRERDLLPIDPLARIDAIDIKDAGGGVIKLRRPDATKPWKLYRGSGAPLDADEASVKALIDALSEKRTIKDFLPADTKEGNAVAVVSLWVNGIKPEEEKKEEEKKDDKKEEKKEAKKDGDKKEEKKEEKKPESTEPKLKSDKPTYQLTFGKRDSDKGVVYVRREIDGVASVVTVPDSILAKVTAGPLAYLDRTLPSFSEEVTKVVLERDGKTYEMVKETKDGKSSWVIKQPKELAGRPANAPTVDGIIGTLRFLRAEKLVAEKASAAQEEEYGLKPPKVKVVLTLKKGDKTEDVTFAFGKETDTGVYGRRSGAELVYQVARHQLAPLEAELRDQTVFRFDAAKVKELRLKGWSAHTKPYYELVLERKGPANWAVTKSTTLDYKVDSGKVEQFVSMLAALRAEKFLGSTAKPEYKLDLKDNALEIQISLADEKEPLTLTIGALDADKKAYYATSNKLGGEFVLVPREVFDDVKNKEGESSKGTPYYFFKD